MDHDDQDVEVEEAIEALSRAYRTLAAHVQTSVLILQELQAHLETLRSQVGQTTEGEA